MNGSNLVISRKMHLFCMIRSSACVKNFYCSKIQETSKGKACTTHTSKGQGKDYRHQQRARQACAKTTGVSSFRAGHKPKSLMRVASRPKRIWTTEQHPFEVVLVVFWAIIVIGHDRQSISRHACFTTLQSMVTVTVTEYLFY